MTLNRDLKENKFIKVFERTLTNLQKTTYVLYVVLFRKLNKVISY